MRDASLALIALAGFSALNAVDSVLARVYLPAAESGYYIAAATAAQIAIVLPAAVGVMAFPRFVAAARQGDGHRVLIESVLVVGTLGGLAAAILTAFPHEIVSVLFGSRYSPAAGTLQFLAWEGVALGLISVLVFFHLGQRKFVAGASWLGVVGAGALVASAVHGSSRSIRGGHALDELRDPSDHGHCRALAPEAWCRRLHARPLAPPKIGRPQRPNESWGGSRGCIATWQSETRLLSMGDEGMRCISPGSYSA